MHLTSQHLIIFVLCAYVRNISNIKDIFMFRNLLIDSNYFQWARTSEKQTIPHKLLRWQKPRCSHSMHFLYTNDNQLSHKKDLCCTLHLWSWELCVRRCVCVCVCSIFMNVWWRRLSRTPWGETSGFFLRFVCHAVLLFYVLLVWGPWGFALGQFVHAGALDLEMQTI